MAWSTGYWMDVPPARKYASVAVWDPVGPFTPRPSAMFPEWLCGSNNHRLPTRLTSPSPIAVTAWRAESAYSRDCMPYTKGIVRLRLHRSVTAYVVVTSTEWTLMMSGLLVGSSWVPTNDLSPVR